MKTFLKVNFFHLSPSWIKYLVNNNKNKNKKYN